MPARDTTNRKNLGLLIQLRWIAVVGQVATIAVVRLWLGIALPLAEMGAVVLFLVGLNLVSLLRHRRRQEVTNTELFLELLLDVAALTAQLYLSGGAQNPFISLYLLQVILGSILLEAWSVWTLVAVTSGCFVLLTTFYRPISLPHLHGSFLSLHVQGMFICYVLAACLLVLFINRINRNLKARDERLAELRRQAVAEDHIVRLGLLSSGAAHELGTPLATMSVIIGDWRKAPALADNPELADELEEIQAQLDRCKAIVSGILVASGEARGEGTVRTGMRDFFDGVAEEWSATRSPRALRLDNRVPEGLPMLSDRAIKQVVFNLLDNALEASPAHVTLEVALDRDALTVTVSDRGAGFDDDVLARLGQPYVSTKQRPGSGLGLFLVANVARKLGGRVEARNGRDGAVVSLVLPVSALSDGRR
ncbi:MAG: HAMP domain-containing histidine kinase [Rhizobiales bacterium]|nr:HAMP domain-containing histidine kinase [Hyphomicrobiales bacterium]